MIGVGLGLLMNMLSALTATSIADKKENKSLCVSVFSSGEGLNQSY